MRVDSERDDKQHPFTSVSLARGESVGFESIRDKEVLNREYAAWRELAERARVNGSGEEYADAVRGLLWLMRCELWFYHANEYGDMSHSLMNWRNDVGDRVDQENIDKLRRGEGVNWRTNTLDNHKSIHPSDETSVDVSKSMAGVVTRFVNSRGGDYVEATVATGERMTSASGYDLGPGSPYQVLTKIKGFEVVKPKVKLPTFEVDWESAVIK